MATLPGLVSDFLSGVVTLTARSHVPVLSTLSRTLMTALIFMPLPALIYLVVLGFKFKGSGYSKTQSVLLFVLLYGLLNAFLWGAGCTLILASVPFS